MPVALQKPLALSIALLLLLPTLLFVFSSESDVLVRFFPDDAFYYLQTAYNWVNFGHSSFDGINLSNGVHPLQFLFVSITAAITDKDGMLRLAILENAVLIVASSYLICRYQMNKLSARQSMLGFLLLSLPIWYLYVWLDAGMEIGLVIFFGVFFYCAFEQASRQRFQESSYNLVLALAISLLFLSRLDTIIALVPFALLALYQIAKDRPPLAALVLPLALIGLMIVPYLLINHFVFGHIVPISGHVKSSVVTDFATNWRGLSSGTTIGTIITFTPLIVFGIALLTQIKSKAFPALLCLLVSGLLYYVYILFFSSGIFRWYLAYPLVLQITGMAIIYRTFCQTYVKPNIPYVLLTSTLLLSLIFQYVLINWAGKLNTTSHYLYTIADAVDRQTDPTDIVATHDAGVIGFFADVSVINLDGLINSLDYYRNYHLTGKYQEYFSQSEVTHLLLRTTMIKMTGTAEHRQYRFRPDQRVIFQQNQLLDSYSIPGQFDLMLFKTKKQA